MPTNKKKITPKNPSTEAQATADDKTADRDADDKTAARKADRKTSRLRMRH